MPERPYTILSCSISLDGYLGGATEERLVLSNDADLDRVDRVRSGCDAILVGAGTVRDDNPRLLVRDPLLRAQRRARGLAESPAKVTMTRHAQLDAGSNFFATGDSEKIVYCPSDVLPPVDEAVEGEHPRRHRRPVSQPQRQANVSADAGEGWLVGDGFHTHGVSSNRGERA
jgi:riboflavin biosynthesis pyrimidine reductase